MKSLFATARLALAGALVGALALAAPAFAPAAHAQDAVPSKPEAGTFKLGVEPWLGYGLWHVAADKGFFKDQGVDVNIVNFTQDKDINAALASGDLDGASIATHTAMAMAAAGLPIKIVMLLDISNEADAILAGKDITSIKDLKGKQVAFEQGTTSDILINYALAANGMTIADIEVVPMPASDAGAALIAGRVPVAVTYEPYLTMARNQNKDVKLLFTAGTDPGLISDVLVVRDDVVKSKPGQIRALVQAWAAAYTDYEKNKTADRAIISKAVGASPDELATAFDGVKYFSLAENKKMLTGDFTNKVFDDVAAAAKKAGILQTDVSAKTLIDPAFVEAAQ